MDVTQVVLVSVVGTQSLFRVPEISAVPSSELERATGCPDCGFRLVLKQAFSAFSGGAARDAPLGFREGKMQFRSRAHLGDLSLTP